MQSIYLWITTVVLLGIFDFLWIGLLMQKFYKAQLGPLLQAHPVWWAAGVFYLLYAAALVFFIINPALESRSLEYAILAGLFFGLTAFGTYDLTNMTTIPNWTLSMTVVDMAWGAFAGGAVSALVYLIATGVFGM
jgi:uncharacterized membrane protein